VSDVIFEDVRDAQGNALALNAPDHKASLTGRWIDEIRGLSVEARGRYANTFPVTPLGKIIGAVVMMVGPALSGRVFDHVERPTTPAPADPLLLAKLDEVIAELKKSRQPAG